MSATLRCPKDGETNLVAVRPVYEYAGSWWRMLFGLAPGRKRVGDVVLCTRHACGRVYVATQSGLAECDQSAVGGRTVVRVSQPAGAEREGDERERVPDGVAVPRAEV